MLFLVTFSAVIHKIEISNSCMNLIIFMLLIINSIIVITSKLQYNYNQFITSIFYFYINLFFSHNFVISKYHRNLPNSSVTLSIKVAGNNFRPSGEHDNIGPHEFTLNPLS